MKNARATSEKYKRPFRRFWKFFFDDKNSVGVRVTTRIQRRLADIQAETNIPLHDFFTLIEGHLVRRHGEQDFREQFIAEMFSEVGIRLVSEMKMDACITSTLCGRFFQGSFSLLLIIPKPNFFAYLSKIYILNSIKRRPFV